MSGVAFDLVIFDCDGVLINSEEIASGVCVEALAQLGMHLTLQQYAARYSGRPVADAWRQVETDHGKPLPDSFREKVDTEVLRRFSVSLEPMEGVVDVLTALRLPRCVASSTTLHLLKSNLVQVGLSPFFDPSVFSVSQVKRGKPAPDVFLFAASQMGADPHRCIVIEDSAAGVAAARRAGMRAIGFSGGGHTAPDHAERLTAEGASEVVRAMRELAPLLT